MLRRHIICIMVFAISLLSFSCKQRDTTFERIKEAGKVHDGIVNSFKSTFPDKFESFEEPPMLGSVGELPERSNLKFILFNFPDSKISELEPWIRPLIKQYDLESVRISYFVYSVEESKNILTGVKFVQYGSDGSTVYKSSQKLGDAMPHVTLEGRAIPQN